MKNSTQDAPVTVDVTILPETGEQDAVDAIPTAEVTAETAKKKRSELTVITESVKVENGRITAGKIRKEMELKHLNTAGTETTVWVEFDYVGFSLDEMLQDASRKAAIAFAGTVGSKAPTMEAFHAHIGKTEAERPFKVLAGEAGLNPWSSREKIAPEVKASKSMEVLNNEAWTAVMRVEMIRRGMDAAVVEQMLETMKPAA